LLQRDSGKLLNGEPHSGFLKGDLGLQFGPVTSAAEPAEVLKFLPRDGEAQFGKFQCALALAPILLESACRHVDEHRRAGLRVSEFLGGRSL
jgi:hypothetical protein